MAPIESKNVISTETIAIHTITNIILWSFSVLCIPWLDTNGKVIGNPGDGQYQNVGRNGIWLYTPPSFFGLNEYTKNPTPAPVTTVAGVPTPAPSVARNIDLGGNALHETANIAFGIASTVGAVILVCRAATNTVINHPRSTTKSPKEIAHFEHVMLTFAWSATVVGMIACGLGYEAKTGWAVFSVAVFSVVGYIVCYCFQVEDDKIEAGLLPPKEGALPLSLNPVPPPHP